jgi:hypothetical protein
MATPEATNQSAVKSRNEVLQEIRVRFGAMQPYTIWIIDALLAAWDTMDMLTSVFEREIAQTYIQAGFEPIEEGNHDDNDQ